MGAFHSKLYCAAYCVCFCLSTIALSISVKADLIGHGGIVRDVAVSADGKRVLTASFDFSAVLWAFADQSELRSLQGHDGPVNAVAFILGAEKALSGGDDGRVIAWNLTTGEQVSDRAEHIGKVSAVAVSPDGNWAASAGWDATVRMWQIDDAEPSRVIEYATAVTALAFDALGQHVISGDRDGRIAISHVATGEVVADLQGHNFGVTDLIVMPDGERLVSAGIDGAVRLWSLSEQREIRTIAKSDIPVYAVAVSNDGDTLLSAGQDGTVSIHAVDDSVPARSIFAHEAPVWAIALTPDDRFLLTASSDESVRVWHIETGDRVGTPGGGRDEPEPWLTSRHPGAQLYRACANCHALSATARQRSGPHFAGLFGREAGAVAGYNYSPSLESAEFTWTDETLRALFKQGPDEFVPGSKMPLQRITDDGDLAALIDYMRELTAPPASD